MKEYRVMRQQVEFVLVLAFVHIRVYRARRGLHNERSEVLYREIFAVKDESPVPKDDKAWTGKVI